VHKRIISYCAKDSSGKIYAEGSLPASPEACLPTGPHQSKAPEARQKLAHCACPERGRRVSGGIKFPHQKSPSPGGAADSSALERISWEQRSAISKQEARKGRTTNPGSAGLEGKGKLEYRKWREERAVETPRPRFQIPDAEAPGHPPFLLASVCNTDEQCRIQVTVIWQLPLMIPFFGVIRISQSSWT